MSAWSEVASTVIYLENRTPTRSLGGKTPYKTWYQEKLDMSQLRALSCDAYVHVPKQQRKKLNSHTKQYQLVGYNHSNIYRLWDANKKEIICARNVIFDEGRETMKADEEDIVELDPLPLQPKTTSLEQSMTPRQTIPPESDPVPEQEGESQENVQAPGLVPAPSEALQELRRSERPITGKLPSRLLLAKTVTSSGEPKTYQEAQASSKQIEWELAMEQEMESHRKNGTWDLDNLPAERKVLSGKWVYKIKTGPDGPTYKT